MTMTPPKDPSDLRPEFTWDRIIIIGQIAFDRARHVARGKESDDSNCCTGLKRFDHIRAAILRAAIKEHSVWLSVPEQGVKYTGAMDMVPFRVLRGDPDEPIPEKYAN